MRSSRQLLGLVRSYGTSPHTHTARAASTALGRVTLGAFATAAAGAGIYIAASEHPASSAHILVQSPVRLLRDVYAALAVIADYKASSTLLRRLASLQAAAELAICACSGHCGV